MTHPGRKVTRPALRRTAGAAASVARLRFDPIASQFVTGKISAVFEAHPKQREAAAHSAARPALHAGRYYPAEPEFLAKVTDSSLEAAIGPWKEWPKAVIAPHGGFVFSGAVAAKAFAPWKQLGRSVERVVMIGPSHLFDFPGVALPDCAEFQTPLGTVPVDAAAFHALQRHRFVRVFEAAHLQEHALETLLPFVQRIFKNPRIVPLVTGRIEATQMAGVFEELWGGDETVFILSSDLSHGHNYETTQKIDRNTAQIIQALERTRLTADQACGFQFIRGFLRCAIRREMRCVTADLRNSGDTTSAMENLTGYGAFHFYES